MLVQRQVRHQPLQPRILVAQLANLPQFAQPQLAVLLLPDVERRLRNPELPANIPDRRPTIRLPQRVRDLLLAPTLSRNDEDCLPLLLPAVLFGSNVNRIC